MERSGRERRRGYGWQIDGRIWMMDYNIHRYGGLLGIYSSYDSK